MNRRVFLAWLAGLAAVGTVGVTAERTVVRDVELPPVKTPTGADRMYFHELYSVTAGGYVATKIAERWPHQTAWRYDRATWRESNWGYK